MLHDWNKIYVGSLAINIATYIGIHGGLGVMLAHNLGLVTVQHINSYHTMVF
jgi:hypothetical protein